MNGYLELHFVCGTTIEEAVNELLQHKESGQLAYGDFNGRLLYSDTVTLDSAYQEITGQTKLEFDMERQKEKDEYEKNRNIFLENLNKSIMKWKKKGYEILTEDKWPIWDNIVCVRAKDIYEGMELDASLDIIKILKDSSFEKANEKLDSQGHSGMSYAIVCSIIKDCADNGKEFIKFLNK